MTDYPDLCNDEPSCFAPELRQRIAELEAEVAALKAEKTADTDRPQYHICPKHPWLTATSVIGASHLCPACNAEQYKAVIKRVEPLPDKWRSEAASQIPDDYTARGLERKYLNCDNYASGMADCADELQAAIKGEMK